MFEPGFFEDRQGPVLVHFDADMYSSTLFLLGMLWHHIAEYYFIFDGFDDEEVIALHDFLFAYPMEIAFHAGAEHHAGALKPMQVFGHMKKLPFTLS